MEPQPKLNACLNYTTRSLHNEYLNDIRDIIVEGTTYQLAHGFISTDQLGGSIVTRGHYPSETNCHINKSPHICNPQDVL